MNPGAPGGPGEAGGSGVGGPGPPLGQPLRDERSLEARLERLSKAESELDAAVTQALSFLTEVSKDRMPGPKTLEPLRTAFADSVKRLEAELKDQIHQQSHLAIGAPHQASVYPAAMEQANAEAALGLADEQLGLLHDSLPDSLPAQLPL